MVGAKTLDRPGLQKATRGALHRAGLPIGIRSYIPRTHIFEALGAPDRCGVIGCLQNLQRSFANLRLPPSRWRTFNTLPRASAARSDERALRLADRGFENSNLETAAFSDQSEAHKRTLPPHARGLRGAAIQRSDPPKLYPSHGSVCRVLGPLSRHGDPGRRAQLPGAYQRARRTTAEVQQCDLGEALLLWP